MEAKRRITKFNFDQEKMLGGQLTHVALVDEAANLTQALILKSKETITEEYSRETVYEDDGSSTERTNSVRIYDYGEEKVRVVAENKEYMSMYVKVR